MQTIESPRISEAEAAKAARAPLFRRLGSVFCPCGQSKWMQTHAANPTPVVLDDDLVRVYFSCRDVANRSHVGYIDMELKNDQARVVDIAKHPVISPGTAGYFDDSGITAGRLAQREQGDWMFYYLGWNLAHQVPFRNSIGAAQGNFEQGFTKVSLAPVIDRSAEDPLTVSYPWVLREGSRWRMWYGTHVSWATERYEMIHVMAHAQSHDGVEWKKTGHVHLPFVGEKEFGFSRPCVIHENGIYKMWFSVRGEQYRIAYAESADGLSWNRLGYSLSASGEGFDSDSAAYASIFTYQGKQYMVYCGNGYGQTGFGLAVLD